jgi:hypothetical protein
MQPIYVSKNLVAASSNGIGSISTAVPSVVTLNTSNLDTGRRIIFTSTAADTSSLTLTFTGLGEQRSKAFSESVSGSTAGAGTSATTTSDFLSVSSVTASSNANVPILIGTSSVGGTQWKLSNWHIAPHENCGYLHFSTSANGMQARYDVTLDDPTGTYPNPYFSVPIVFNSTSPVGTFTSTDAIGNICVDGNVMSPFTAWRLTITSSSSGAGTVYGTVLQAGIG